MRLVESVVQLAPLNVFEAAVRLLKVLALPYLPEIAVVIMLPSRDLLDTVFFLRQFPSSSPPDPIFCFLSY